MKKVKLSLESLVVDSFTSSQQRYDPQGTVRGNATTLCSPEDTCAPSCLDPNSCFGSCACTGPDDPRC
jgi:hypothetical protein